MKSIAVAFLCTIVMLAVSIFADAPQVHNFSVSQRPDEPLVDMWFDLSDTQDTLINIAVAVSTNDGASYDIIAPSVSGDVGDAVRTGALKHIIWDASTDLPMMTCTTTRVKLIADDYTPRFPGVATGFAAETGCVSVAWLPAQDRFAPEDFFIYSIYAATNVEVTDVHQSAHLRGVLTNELACTLSNLADGATYNMLVLAENTNGLCSQTLTPFYITTIGGYADVKTIPAGGFVMGNCMDPLEGYADELPLHTVSVSAVAMDRYEVCLAFWNEVYLWATNHGYSLAAADGKDAASPAVNMTWYDAVKWCNARSEKKERVPCYYTDNSLLVPYRAGETTIDNDCVNWGANGYRLPTEAEWEKAARGGNPGLRFAWSDNNTIQHDQANYYSTNSYPYDVSLTRGHHPLYSAGAASWAAPVNAFASNGYGFHNLTGNVWEWCWDWYSVGWYNQPAASADDSRGPLTGVFRVQRGGCFMDDAFFARSAMRECGAPWYRYSDTGLRCVRQ